MPAERIVDGKVFSYTGLINFKDLYSSIKGFWEGKGYDFIEKKHEEKVRDDGSRSINFDWHCEKDITDYVKHSIDFNISADSIKLVNVGGYEKEYIENFNVKINADLIYDLGKMFGDKPFNIFLRGLFEKYVYGSELKEHRKSLSKVVDEFLNMLKDFTASYKL